MTRAGSTDDGPRFLSDLQHDLERVRRQQQSTEQRLAELRREHAQCDKRINALEAELREVSRREEDIEAKLDTAEARRKGQLSLVNSLLAPVLLVLTWFLSMVWFAVEHAKLDEPRRRQQETPPRAVPPPPQQQRNP